MSDPSALIDALQRENAILRQQVAQLEEQQSVRHLPVALPVAIDYEQAELQREAALEALRASAGRLKALVQVAPLAITLLDTAGNVQLWNPAAEEIFGWTASEVIGRPNPIVPAGKQSEYAAWGDQVLHGGPIADQEAIRQRNDGTLVAVSISSAPVYDAAGNVTGRMAIIADITEKKRVEEALRESELLYESLVEVSPLSICRKDLAGRFTFANRRFLEESDITLADLVGKTDFDLHPPELAEKYRRDDRAVIASGQVWELIEERAIPGVESIVVQSIKTPIYDGSGNMTGIQISFWDITARRRAEEALRASEEKYRTLAEAADDMIYMVDADQRVLYANHHAARLFDREPAELLGMSLAALFGAEVAHRLWANMEPVFQCAESRGYESYLALPDGGIWVSAMLAPLKANDGHVTSVLGISRDITARKRVEAALRDLNATLEQRVADRTRELAEVSRLKDEFISRISHELRTPLANIKLYLQLLEQGQPEKRTVYFQTLRQQADRLHHLIEDLLDVSRLTLNEIEIHAAPVDVVTLLHDLITDQMARALERGLSLAASSTPDRPTLITDRALLRQALGNVLSNALNYTPASGTITLHADRATTPEGEWVTIEMRDTGAGISAQDLPHIFEPFYRGAAAADYKTPGTGVGLAIAQRLIERLGGRITVESSPGQGATFTIWLR